MIIYIYTQYIIVINYKDKNGSLKLIEFRPFFFLSFFFSFFFFLGGGGVILQTQTPKILPKHIANTPMQYTVIFHSCINTSFQTKNCDIFLNFAQNIDFGYSLSGSNVYTGGPCGRVGKVAVLQRSYNHSIISPLCPVGVGSSTGHI